MKVFLTGFNGFGQLPIESPASKYNTHVSQFLPCRLKNVLDIDFCWPYCVLLTDSGVYASGFLSNSDKKFIKLSIPSSSPAVQVSCSTNYLVIVTECGECWQYWCSTGTWKKLVNFISTENEGGQKVVKFLCGKRVNVALSLLGHVYDVPALLSVPGEKVIDIACGLEHNILLTERGQVYTWGTGTRGQLGHGEVENEEAPREVDALSGLKVICIAAGGWHSACITSDGDLYTWGWNCSGQLGLQNGTKRCKGEDGESTITVQMLPAPVEWPDDDNTAVKEVACGTRHTLCLTDDGSLWGCGWNGYGQLGLSLDEVTKTSSMIKINTMPNRKIINLKCGAWNSSIFVET